MPLPTEFSPWEHLQNTLRFAVNQQIRKEFDDIQVDDDITTPRGSLKVACLLDDKDTSSMTIIRLILYYIVVKGLAAPSGYSIPFQIFNDEVRYHPQIHLHFSQNYRDVDEGESIVEGQIKIRIMGETSVTFTPAKSNIYAQKIKTLFGAGDGFRWQKGKGMFTYAEPEKGYFMQLLVISKTEGRRIAEQVLDIQSHTPDWKFATYKENEEPTQAYPLTPPLKTIYGKSRRSPRSRPVATVRFRNAFLNIDGLPNPIVLYDNSGYYKKAIVKD